MATSQKNTKRKSSAKSKSSTRSKSAARSKSTAKAKSPAKKMDQSRQMQLDFEKKEEYTILRDIILLAIFAISILIFISELGIGGKAGSYIRSFFFGLAGYMAYALPFFMTFGAAFYVANRKSRLVYRKLFGALGCYFFLCGFFQLLMMEGGLLGAMQIRLFKGAFGTVGAYVIVVFLFAIFFILMTQRAFLTSVAKKGRKSIKHFQIKGRERKERRAILKEEAEIEKDLAWEERMARKTREARKKREFAKEQAEEKRRRRAQEELWGDDAFSSPNPSQKQVDFLVGKESSRRKKKSSLDSGNVLGATQKENSERERFQDPFALNPDLKIEGIDEPAARKSPEFTMPNFLNDYEAKKASGEENPINDIVFSDMPNEVHTEEQMYPDLNDRSLDHESALPSDTLGSGNSKASDENPDNHEKIKTREKKKNPRSSQEEITAGIEAVQQTIQEKESEETVKKIYHYPPVSLLKKPQNSGNSNKGDQLRATAQKLQQTLKNFGVNVTISNISCGPTVTRYELAPEQGVKVSKIVSLADDIKLNLAAADIRIEAPIPGKAAVGIEVPNKTNSAVLLRELLESPEFREHPSKLAFAVGKDIAGKPVISDIAKMPHLLIAGATGSGKSVCINTLIMSILYKAKPEEVKLIMIDPKVVELSVYNKIPHLYIPVVTDPKKAAGALNWAVQEMTERYNKFAEYGVRDLKGYNEKVDKAIESLEGIEGENKPKRLPQLVIIVDELADLMMVAPGEVEDAICRLAQLARAAGIHLIIATQRPSVNVITGLIKANMPSRIAFSVSSGVDSRTILDMNGAEKLLGKGDMLFYPQGYQKPARVQGSFVSDNEVSDVVEFLIKESEGCGYAQENAENEKMINNHFSSSMMGSPASERDAYFEKAARFIIEKDKASIGMLQRMFKIGFNRAARIMDQLSDAGVVGPEEGTKPRKVLMSTEDFERFVEEEL